MLSQEETTRLRKLVHDLNNALAPVLMAGELLRPLVPEGRGVRLIDTLCISAQQSTEIVREIHRLIQEAPRPAPPAPPGGPDPGALGSPR
jgi:hypothetical protein